jgi:hypothetical protein
MALDCLGSLQRLCSPSPALRLHDDGTLTDEDCERLQNGLHSVEIVRRTIADERVMEEHGRRRHLLELRKTYPPILKAIDAVLFCDEPIYAFCDSDVLFLRRLHNPFRLQSPETGAVFMQDREPSYSLRSWQKALSPRVELPSQINSGMIVARRDAVDFDELDWFVGEAKHRGIPGVIEQTFWGMLGARIGCRVFDPVQVRVMRTDDDFEGLVVGHFTARTRPELASFVQQSIAADVSAEPVEIATAPAGRCTAWDLWLYEVRRLRQRLAR